MAENDGPTHVVYRSSVTGHFVTKKFARRHPRTTYKDTVPDGTAVVWNDHHEVDADHEAAASAS